VRWRPRLVRRIAEIDSAAWDACAGTENPFTSHAFLLALEESGAVADDKGWAPHHLALEDEAGAVVAVAPAYLKSHSYGEYVFDHGWAEAYERAGGRYYPKLQIAVPFTPVPGPRLLVRSGPNQDERRRALIATAVDLVRDNALSSLHVTFSTEAEARLMEGLGLLRRRGQQFHWENRGFADFDAFLAALAARKRKAIRKERREVAAAGIAIETLLGAEIREEHWDAMFAFYMDTGSRKWGRPYLNRKFFSLVGESMKARIVLFLARRDGRAIAGALNFLGSDCLYGRYWGSIEEVKHLHFELCYYRAIDHAIRHRLARVEAGAQGPHKLARGYLARPTHSAHFILDPGFRRAVGDFVARERLAVDADIDELESLGPFRKDGAGGDRSAG
jgi:predicted N-acyltransferase